MAAREREGGRAFYKRMQCSNEPPSIVLACILAAQEHLQRGDERFLIFNQILLNFKFYLEQYNELFKTKYNLNLKNKILYFLEFHFFQSELL